MKTQTDGIFRRHVDVNGYGVLDHSTVLHGHVDDEYHACGCVHAPSLHAHTGDYDAP